MKRTTLQRGDARLAVRDSGADRSPLVLIHGLDASHKSWAKLVAALGDRYRIISYDQRGHGASSRASDYSWPSFVGDLEALINALALTDFTLVGQSLGAGVALIVASRTTACRALTMIDGGFPAELPPPATGHLDEVRRNPLDLARRRLARLRKKGLSMSAAEALTFAEDYRGRFPAFEQALRHLACPAQYLLAADDAPGPNARLTQAARRATADVAVTLNPLVEVRWIDAGHAMMLTHPRQVAQAVLELDPEC